MRIPVVVSIGDFTSGVTSWAFRLKRAFEQNPKYRIVLVNCSDKGRDNPGFDHTALAKEDMKRILADLGRAVVVPNFVFDVYALTAELIEEGRDLRCIGFCRADSDREYYNPLRFYAPVVSQFAAVSPECASNLAQRLPERKDDITIMPTGVTVPTVLERTYSADPIRLVYGGRIVHVQKRVMDFVPLVEGLLERGVDFTFDIAGSGRADTELRAAMDAIEHGGRVRFLGKVTPADMEETWKNHDVFIQTSDYEGTSNSMLESMAQGTIPVLTETESGVTGIIEDRANGYLVPIGDMTAMAEIIAELAAMSEQALATLGRAAYETAQGYSIERYVEKFSALLDRTLESPAPAWPAGRAKNPSFDTHGLSLSDGTNERLGPELLQNPTFGDWENGVPAAWSATEGNLRERPDADDSSGVLEIIPGNANNNVHLQQTFEANVTEQSSMLRVALKAKASEPEVFGYNLYVSSAGKEKAYKCGHPGDGQWHTMTTDIELPVDVEALRLFVVLRQGATQSVVLEHASAAIRQPDQATEELVSAPAPVIRPKDADTKRLLILFPSPVRGGAEDYTVAVAREGIARGWDVHASFVLCPEMNTLIRDYVDLGAQYHPLNFVDIPGKRLRFDFRTRVRQLRHLLRRVKPDAVLLELCGIQYGLAPIIACVLTGTPVAVIFQMVREGVTFSFSKVLIRTVARLRRQQYVAVSECNREIVARCFRMREDQIELIPNGAEPARFDCTADERAHIRARIRDELGLPRDTILLLTVGRLAPQKGHDILIPIIPHIVAKYPKVRFIWAGDGPLEDQLRASVEECGVTDYVQLLGRRTDIPDLLRAADLFVHPTRFEGQPFSMVEAMAAELAIITTRASGIAEIVEHERTGVLCDVEDVGQLREAVLHALEDPARMRAMAIAARERMEDFSEQKMFDKTFNLLDRLMR